MCSNKFQIMGCNVSASIDTSSFVFLSFKKAHHFQILLIASISVFSLTSAVSVDYYPQPEHHQHVKYIQPERHQHVKYIQPEHRQHVKYVHPEHNQHTKYIQPAHVAPVKYVHQPEHVVKYINKPHHQVDYDEPAQYEYGYSVQDEHTGDIKSHTEKRDGDTVHGRYELIDPDGFKRIVEYTADAHNGFNAVVRREPTDIKIPVPAPTHDVKLVQKVYSPQPQHQPQIKYYTPQPAPVVAQPKYYTTPAQPKYYSPAPPLPSPQPQKYVITQPLPVVKALKHYAPSPAPQYYAPPEHPKYYKPYHKVVKPVYAPEQQTAIKYVQPAPHYTKEYQY